VCLFPYLSKGNTCLIHSRGGGEDKGRKYWWKPHSARVKRLSFLSLLKSPLDAERNSVWRRKWQPTPVFLPGESWGLGSLVGCHLWGCTESDTTEVILAAAAAGTTVVVLNLDLACHLLVLQRTSAVIRVTVYSLSFKLGQFWESKGMLVLK